MTTASGDVRPVVPPAVGGRTRVGRWWLDAPLRRKLLTVAVLIALVWLPPIGVALAIHALLEEARESAAATTRATEALDDFEDSVVLAQSTAQRYAVVGFTDPGEAAEYRGAIELVPAQLAALRDALPPQFAGMGRDLQVALETMTDDLDELANFGAAGTVSADVDPDPAVFELSPDLVEVLGSALGSMAATDRTLAELHTDLDERLAGDLGDVGRLQRQLVRATLATMLGALAVATIGTYVVASGVLRRIETLSDNADRFIRGDPLLPARTSSDEIGRLTDQMLFAGELLDTRRRQAVTATGAKDDFLSRVSHELKTPLTAIIGFAQLLEEDDGLSPARRDDARRIVTAGRHLHELIEELLDIKAIEAGKFTMTLEPVPVGEVIDESVTLVRSLPASHGITISVDSPAGLVMMVDRRRLREVLRNLLSNAVQYNRRGGDVVVVAERRADLVRITVTDTGPGISHEDQQRLFQPFERLDAAGTDIEGSGVGLALTRHVVHAMGGATGVASEIGRGTTFWVDLPLATAREPAVVGPPVPATARSPKRTDGAARPQRNPLVPPVTRARTRAGRWWLDTPLRRKLLIVVALITVVSLPPMGVALLADARLDDARAERQSASQTQDWLHALQESLQSAKVSVNGYAVLGFVDQQFVDAYYAAAASVPVELAMLQDGVSEDLAADGRELDEDVVTLFDDLDRVIAQGPRLDESAAPSDRAVFELDDELAEAMVNSLDSTAAVEESVRAFEDQVDEDLAVAGREVDRLQDLLVITTLASMVAALAVAAGGTWVVTQGVVRRIEVLSENADRFIRGVRLKPAPAAADEIGQLTDKMLFAGNLLNRRRQQAVTATRAKDDFLARVSHELGTPLGAMIRRAHLLHDDPGLSPAARADAAHIVNAGHHLRGLIEELLDIEAIETGRLGVTFEPVTVRDTAEDVVALVRSMPVGRSITITTDCPPDLVVTTDRRRLREVLLNLLSNAVKYNHAHGRVLVIARNRGEAVRISVTDTGVGIAPEDQQLLFTPFERLDAADTDIEGSGVGLALTKQVVEAMGGAIGVDSAPGEGSTFWIDLPAGPPATVSRPDGDLATSRA